jgi:FMN-dependent NADH-azoreductase
MMKNLLRLTTSLFEENSVSSALSADLIFALKGKGEDFNVIERDFNKQAIPHLDGQWLKAISTPAAQRTPEQQEKVEFSDSLIAEIQVADILVIGLPMYNFTVPSMLKAWIDHIARAGVTFAYTEQGPKGLLKNKKVYLVSAMGGVHDTPATDFLRPYMKLIMGFIGLDDVEIINAGGLCMGEDPRAESLAAAQMKIQTLAA